MRGARETCQQSMMAAAAQVMIWQSDPDKLSTYFNQAWFDFTGRTPQQENGIGWAEGVHPEDVERCLATYAQAFDARRDFEMQFRQRRHDGEYRWILYRGKQLRGEDDSFLGYIGGCIDITERERLGAQECEHLLDAARRSIAEELREHAAQAVFVVGLSGRAGVAKLGTLVHCFEQRTGIQADLILTGPPMDPLPTDIAETLHAVGRVALANVERHSKARAVVLGLRVGPSSVTLSIQDDGNATSGSVEPTADSASRFGLRAMGQRVRHLGGTLVARPGPDGGFVVRLRLPLRADGQL
jgi:PAS domain S-box-containing protein